MGESWEHLERKRHSRVGSNAERGSDKGSSVGMATGHIQSARGQSIGANVTRRIESTVDRCYSLAKACELYHRSITEHQSQDAEGHRATAAYSLTCVSREEKLGGSAEGLFRTPSTGLFTSWKLLALVAVGGRRAPLASTCSSTGQGQIALPDDSPWKAQLPAEWHC